MNNCIYVNSYVNSVLLKVFESENLLLMFFNIFIFIIIEIIFFWYILSYTLVYIVLDKSELIIYMLQQDPNLKKSMINYLNSKEVRETLPQLALIQENDRNSTNYKLILQYLGPMIYSIFAILISITIYKLFGYRIVNRCLKNTRFKFNGTQMSRSSYFLLLCVLCSFITEILFYYIVIRSWKFISDAQLILLLYPRPQ